MTITWSEVHKKKVITKLQLNMSKHAWQKCGKLYFKYFQIQKGYDSDKNLRRLMTLKFNLKFINVSKHIEEKCGKLCISSILSSKRGITPTKIDDTRSWSDVHSMKVIYKISAQYAKACRRKVQKTISSILSSKMGHNSYKHWRKLTTLGIDLYNTVTQSHIQNFSSIYQSM